MTVRRSSRDAPAEAHALQPPRCRTRLCCCAVFPLEGHQAFSSGPLKGVEQHKRRKLSSSRSSDDLRAGRHQATRIKACPRTRSDVVANGTGCAQEEALSNNFLEQRHACLHTVRERLALVLVAEPKECIKLRKFCPACHLLVSSRADLVVETAHGRASRQFGRHRLKIHRCAEHYARATPQNLFHACYPLHVQLSESPKIGGP